MEIIKLKLKLKKLKLKKLKLNVSSYVLVEKKSCHVVRIIDFLMTSQDFFWWGHVLHVENSRYVNFHLVLKACLNLFRCCITLSWHNLRILLARDVLTYHYLKWVMIIFEKSFTLIVKQGTKLKPMKSKWSNVKRSTAVREDPWSIYNKIIVQAISSKLMLYLFITATVKGSKMSKV